MQRGHIVAAGFARIMDATPTYFEVNLDVSHYNFRQIRHDQSKALQQIYRRVGHTHQRMCRELGDLSANVPDPGTGCAVIMMVPQLHRRWHAV